MNAEDAHLLCHRCGIELHLGRGDFYVVRIEAFADPTPPEITEADLAEDLDARIEELIEQLRTADLEELERQVYRRLVIHLCRRCYEDWIEDPAG